MPTARHCWCLQLPQLIFPFCDLSTQRPSFLHGLILFSGNRDRLKKVLHASQVFTPKIKRISCNSFTFSQFDNNILSIRLSWWPLHNKASWTRTLRKLLLTEFYVIRILLLLFRQAYTIRIALKHILVPKSYSTIKCDSKAVAITIVKSRRLSTTNLTRG